MSSDDHSQLILFPLISGFVALAVISIILKIKQSIPLDHPNERSMHETPVPRIGGVGIMIGLASGWILAWPDFPKTLLALALALSALSLVDDFRGLSAALRFCAQLLASSILMAAAPEFPGGLIGTVLGVFALSWMSNLYNFMDGSDGLAGGMAVFGFGFYALAAWQGGAWFLASSAACVAAASAGFLWFNFHPARIFMGDSGSVPLGFIAGGMGLLGWQAGMWPFCFPILVFSPFIVDASLTLAKRLLRGEKVWQAHREHYFQRLIRLGYGHRDTAILEYVLMLACGASAMLMLNASAEVQAVVIVAWFAIYALLAHRVDKAWKKQAIEARIV